MATCVIIWRALRVHAKLGGFWIVPGLYDLYASLAPTPPSQRLQYLPGRLSAPPGVAPLGRCIARLPFPAIILASASQGRSPGGVHTLMMMQEEG